MSRGVGAVESIQGLLPEWLALVVALLTQLGDVWFLTLLLAVLYWLDAPRRDAIAVVVGAWIAGTGMYLGLKEVFALPRPNEPLADPSLYPSVIQPVYEATALATGYGFPSGHAVGTTIVYVGLAAVFTSSTRRRRFTGAAALVGTVCFSRVALGVHYLVDVVAGVAAGLLLLLVVRALAARRPDDPAATTFGLAVVFAVFFVVVSGVAFKSILVLAASLGTVAGWRFFDFGRRG
ncbi:phosphoesterase PA-phosphatase [Halostagnicola larsenii XH-48]|uniref:Phosphoesterase PA-phosphatase n=1 Tax=Halostagnicola larsenii XH-48 TaxID=797299 RepID=W0JMY4_9EURY|nr:phosphatase PAP2 family protein [Halostagnicola larsenii]AHF98529.1 phosphoesterase PA-phosphatase [Halostagnicola larsenii XH-48]